MPRNRFILFLVSLGAFVFLWQGFVSFSGISTRILPDPQSVMTAFLRNWELLFEHSVVTIFEALVGLGISIVLGIFLAIIIDASEKVRHFFSPLLIVSQTIPLIALAPVLLVWFGFGILPKVVIVVLYCFFPITLAMLEGLGSLSQDYFFLLRSMNATRWQILKFAKIPTSLPFFMAGLRIAVVYAIAAAIVGEFVGGYQGLGILMLQATNSHRIDLLFAAIIFSSVISMLFFGIVSLLRRRIIPWESPLYSFLR